MPKPKEQSKQPSRPAASPWLVAAVVAVALLGVGLYGARAGWFESDEEEYGPNLPKKGVAKPRRSVERNKDQVAYAMWDVPEGAPVVGVGGAGGPSEATLAVRDGRADVVVRVPRGRKNGTPYMGYSIEVRSGQRRLWGHRIPVERGKPPAEAFTISFNAELLRSIGAASAPITVVVGGSTSAMGDRLGLVQLTLPQTP